MRLSFVVITCPSNKWHSIQPFNEPKISFLHRPKSIKIKLKIEWLPGLKCYGSKFRWQMRKCCKCVNLLIQLENDRTECRTPEINSLAIHRLNNINKAKYKYTNPFNWALLLAKLLHLSLFHFQPPLKNSNRKCNHFQRDVNRRQIIIRWICRLFFFSFCLVFDKFNFHSMFGATTFGRWTSSNQNRKAEDAYVYVPVAVRAAGHNSSSSTHKSEKRMVALKHEIRSK